MATVRTRFAPSPTGFMHVGGLRTALFAWLVARQNSGQFILRIEDTDQARQVAGSAEHILGSLQWLGLNWDEGPFFQSQRLEIYKSWAEKLIGRGRAYADPYSPAELQALRDQSIAAKKPFLYRDYRPERPPKWDGSRPLRFKSQPQNYLATDLVMSEIGYTAASIDDFIIIKSDGFPTYNFAHIIDDYLMKITHVIRGQEFVASQANYFNLYQALDIDAPQIATLPHILGPSGQKKLSKRDAAKDILDYAAEGYLPAAMLNFLATLGWNDGTNQEIYSKKQLINSFKFDRVQKSSARFDEQRLLWMNGCYIRDLKIDELYRRSKNFWPANAQGYDQNYLQQILLITKDRLKFFAELPQLTNFFFEALPVDKSLIESHKQLKKLEPTELINLLKASVNELKDSDFSAQDLTSRLNTLLTITQTSPSILFSLIRIATTQAPASPGLAETMAVLGQATVLDRIDQQIKSL
ncbi:MAG: glutamate--tRNA ligase [Candidatus Saccharimonadales bacterium]